MTTSLGKCCGYLWGVVAAISVLVALLVVGFRMTMAPWTRLMWLLLLAFVVRSAFYEYDQYRSLP